MVADKVLDNIHVHPSDKTVIGVPFEWFELEKKRISKVAFDGMKIGVCVPELLKDGDVLAVGEGKVYVVDVVPTRLIKIHVDTMEQMGRLGFELGNRHLSLRISGHDVWVPFDQPTYEYLLKLGFDSRDVTEQFTDFIECKAHGHSHEKEHVHGNAQKAEQK